ncbi:hypothetical protein QQF45_04150 [Halopseudomonas aestusnigri]|uniref:hypothetical protein n=1 Tax=Halopseudomonas aestusnigri TaxID=857252 RepID=UPI0025538A4B|nr:hypothetical protein [Halopseudomonas aestusnigri]MDL2198250.1 hypothetical protein [Halopseudomonas aestusnigri]
MSATNDAQNFFVKHVTPSFNDWKKSPADERLAMNLASNLNNLIDYYWPSASANDPAKVFHKNSLKEFRAELAKTNVNIGLIRDVADAHKHLKLGRSDRSLTNANQTSPQKVGYGQAYGMAYGGGELLVITLDNGKEEYFSIIAEAAYEYWRNEIQ